MQNDMPKNEPFGQIKPNLRWECVWEINSPKIGQFILKRVMSTQDRLFSEGSALVIGLE